MDPRLLALYNDELAFVRGMGAEFAEAYPKVAGRLGMNRAEVDDPYVERLMEGFAFLAARVQLKLQARFPDFTQHMLELVYPHFLAPTPSMVIAAFHPDREAGRLEKGYHVPRGTRLLAAPAPNSPTACEFRTAQDVHLWPLAVSALEYHASPGAVAALAAPRIRDGAGEARAALRLRLRTTNGLPLNRLAMRALTLHFTGAGGVAAALTEQLLANTRALVLRPTERPFGWQEVLPATAIRQHGLDASEAILPELARSFLGYRLLREYFALPQRTHFAEITGLADAIRQSDTREIELVFLLRHADPRLERQLGPSNIALFATPAVNLFERHADRIHLSERFHEHHVVVDRGRPLDFEIHSILDVQGEAGGDNESTRFQPFYSITDAQNPISRSGRAGGGLGGGAGGTAGRDAAGAPGTGHDDGGGRFYTLRREARQLSARQRLGGGRTDYVGSEGFIALVDSTAAPYSTELRQLSLRCLCSNRDLAVLMPVGRGDTDFTLEIGAPVSAIRCLGTPTRPYPSAAQGEVAWQLMSHLSLNYLSITGANNDRWSDAAAGGTDGSPQGDHEGAQSGDPGGEALREMLRLYLPPGEAWAARQVEGLLSVRSRPVVRRLPGGGPAAVARGLEVEVTLDEAAFEGSGVFPLASVLAQFFAQYVSINSFTETVLRTPQRGEVMRWPMTIGRRPLA